MTAAELAEVMKGIGRLEAKLDKVEQSVWESARQERVRVDRVVKMVVERMQQQDQEADADELAAQRGRRPRK